MARLGREPKKVRPPKAEKPPKTRIPRVTILVDLDSGDPGVLHDQAQAAFPRVACFVKMLADPANHRIRHPHIKLVMSTKETPEELTAAVLKVWPDAQVTVVQ